MRPLNDFPRQEAALVTTVFTDIDDTLTSDGLLPSHAYCALEKLNAAGIDVVPVTGRPAGWCDMIARFWPVRGIVGENGAFHFSYDRSARKMRRVFHVPEKQRAADKMRLDRIRARVLGDVPGAGVSADQAYRESDLAIDFCEDVEPLDAAAVARIKEIFEQEGATAKISSIHVNGWFGDYDKLSMSRQFARDVLNLDIDAQKHRIVFCGDSPNDAPMFGFFPNSCGVANVLDFEDTLDAHPAWLAPSRGAEGFVEIAEHLLAARNA